MPSGLSSVGLSFTGFCSRKKKKEATPATTSRVIDTPRDFDASKPIKPRKTVTQDQFNASGMSPEDQRSKLIAQNRTLSFHEEVAVDNEDASKPLAASKSPKTRMTTNKPPIPWKDYTPHHSEEE